MASIILNDIYIKDYETICGPLEKDSNLKKFDTVINDYYFGEKTFEDAEIKMQRVVMEKLLSKNSYTENDIDLVLGGDLLNQIAITNYSLKNINIPFIGLYNACATFPESIIVGSMFLKNKEIKRTILMTSAHNLTSERQFRYPIEYGTLKKEYSTFTTTAAISTLLTKKEGKIKIESFTIGSVVDMDIKDSNNMGACMAPSAAKTIFEHYTELKRSENYYDLVLTGDLGITGISILKEYLKKEYNMTIKNIQDAGSILYKDNQDTFSGGSGPACLPLVLYNKMLLNNKYKKILIIGTGALHNKTFVDQKKSIPSISHAVSLEVL